MRVMGIETSCDETAVAIVEADAGDRPVGRLLANVVYSQLTEHRRFGGVVPEIAARAHLERIDGLVEQALADSGLALGDLDGIAATGGPGLIGGVMVGVMTAKAIAFAHDKPFLAINHLEGHALSARLTEEVEFPYLLLLVSGGHCQLLTVRGPGDFTRLGTTIDDAVGECFDKTAKLLGLGFPGGPAVERAAQGGDTNRFKLPRPMWRKPGCDFSFSGLKTAVRQMAELLPKDDRQAIADLCASFQRTVGDVLVDRCCNAMARASSDTLVVAGGVAANTYLRSRLEELGVRLVAPPIRFCTDNGAMIAWAGIERLRRGMVDALDFAPRPRWPLDALAGASR
ncbi:MAG TPA: tRNA (adenosine(37)-N6)-threonylcarbamoyltransferase complex transferase subunit TsaD [Reyranella sp.]|nr:tRNA (adenosine(37)-N6)-threonylcarbamoyltransferase complex transferase subunit TsaD [Reyranella sp.]